MSMSTASTCTCQYVTVSCRACSTCVLYCRQTRLDASIDAIDQSYHLFILYTLPDLSPTSRRPFPPSPSQPAALPSPRGTYPSLTHVVGSCLVFQSQQRPPSLPSCQSYAPTLALPLPYCDYCWPAKPYQDRYSPPGLLTRRNPRPPIPAALPSLSLLNLDDCAFEIASR
jgi:hypothetical protein